MRGPVGNGNNVIGVDLGGTGLRAARGQADGTVAAVERVATDAANGPAGVVAQVGAMADRLRDAHTVGIGIGVPGAIDAAAGLVLDIPALPGWAGVPLPSLLRVRLGLACAMENDAKAAAIGEWRAGAAVGCGNFAFITIGTGIGAGIVCDGRLLRGAGGLAGEVGHTHVTDDPAPCACGRTGCLQAVASGTALGNRARARLAEASGSLIAVLAGDGPATAHHVGLAARQGDALALELLADMAGMLGIGFANIQHCYSSERIVVGGGVAALLDLLRPELEATLRARLLPGHCAAAIHAAQLGDDAGLVGAGFSAWDGIERNGGGTDAAGWP